MKGKKLRKITLYEAVYYHRKLWDILARTGTKKNDKNNSELMSFYEIINKSSFISFNYLECRCLACEYASTHQKKYSFLCEHCFLDWWGVSDCLDHSSPYRKFLVANEDNRKMYAEIIRDLPLKPQYVGPYEQSKKRFIEKGGVLLV